MDGDKMNKITIEIVKELRNQTGAGMMDCKKALIESDGIFEVALWNIKNRPPIKVYDGKKSKEFYIKLNEEINKAEAASKDL